MLKRSEENPQQGPLLIIASIGFRMLTSLFLLPVLSFSQIDDLHTLTMQFLILYLVYMVFEMMVVLVNLRRN